MQRHMFKSKLHRATVTEAELHYEGSLSVDEDLMDAAEMIPNEMIQVYNINNGERFETYIIPGPRGSGVICLNGAAARKGEAGDKVIIVTTCWLDEAELAKHQPLSVLVGEDNKIVKITRQEQHGLRVAQ
ncbi:MAG: aspartate 1-decarboxylase [Deltaproteobacteria bacterium]|nr:aspartate 1-decarboxylase [Deltaproteobacteria bacterium]